MKISNHISESQESYLTRFLMLLFSCTRLVIASAALLMTPVTARAFTPSLYLFNRSIRCGMAPASAMSCWCSGCKTEGCDYENDKKLKQRDSVQ